MEEKELVSIGIARGDSIGDSVRRAIRLAGGVDFIRPGDSILIKPNVISPHPSPATTNPEVLYETIKFIWERRPGRVFVGDRSSWRGKTLKYMKKTGIYDAAISANAEIRPFDKEEWIKQTPEGAIHWKKGFSIASIIQKVNHIISLPVVKTHQQAIFTMALKNWVGIINPYYRAFYLHRIRDYGNMIPEIHLAVKPSFIVMDATRVFVSGGPSKGMIKEPGLIIATRDLVANDAVGLAVLKMLDTVKAIQEISLWEQPQIRRAVELGLGVKDASEIQLNAEGVPELERIQGWLKDNS